MENSRFEKLTRRYDGIIQFIGKHKLYKERVRGDFTWGKNTTDYFNSRMGSISLGPLSGFSKCARV